MTLTIITTIWDCFSFFAVAACSALVGGIVGNPVNLVGNFVGLIVGAFDGDVDGNILGPDVGVIYLYLRVKCTEDEAAGKGF